MDSGEEKKFQEISAYLDRVEELEDGTAEAVLLIDEGDEEYSGELILSTKFLPDDVNEGDYLTLKISRDAEKTNAALDAARKILDELEE